MDTKKEILDSILRNVRTEVSSFLDKESGIKCPIEYELTLIKLSRKFALTILEESQGKKPKSRNSKKK